MANNYTYPTQVGAIKRPHTTFSVDAKLYVEDNNVDSPLVIHSPFSRFVFTIINKKQNVTPYANIPYYDVDYIKKMSDVICFASKNTSSSQNAEIPSAFKIPLVGHFRGRTPGQVLLDNPADMEMLLSTKNWLLENLQKFPPNKEQIDAIDEAIKMYNSGTLVAPNSPVASSNKEEIYSSEWKFLKSKRGENNTFLVYNLEINFYPANKYPVEIKIENGYAPLFEQAGGQTTITLSKMENKSSSSIVLSIKEWYTLISKMSRTLNLFENMFFGQEYNKTLNIINSYH
jgi:hypothetical protein